MAKISREINIPINRAEGDLEIKIEITDSTISDAWSCGTMYRGFEEMMHGRGALDGLVITPRVCGICSLTHLTAAAEALDTICDITPPDNARRLRNVALMVETIQSDVRQAVLMFLVDFANADAYKSHPLGEEAQKRYAPLKGRAAIEVIRETKRLLQIVAIIGGQWPHTSFMVPGGVTSIPDIAKILQCQMILERFRLWYERCILGCSIKRWQEIESINDLATWLAESSAHRESEVGFFLRFSRKAGLDRIGNGPGHFLSYGNFTLPLETEIQGSNGRLTGAGFATAINVAPLDHSKIKEDLSHSWFEQHSEPLHPFYGKTKPYAAGESRQLYSWVKAPRYDGKVVETGPLAEMIIDSRPLFQDLIQQNGANVLTRQLARIVRPAYLLGHMATFIDELLVKRGDKFYRPVKDIPNGEGAGMIQAARGALGHWVKIKDKKIVNYQIITPTAWNGSPRDTNGIRGPWEEALIGTEIKNIKNPVEAGHVIRSFDPCLVCAVHCLQKKSSKRSVSRGSAR